MMTSYQKNNNSLHGKKVLLTGATGFIGSHLARKLVDSGCRVTILARHSSDFWRIQDILSKIEIINADLNDLDPEKIQPSLSGTQIIFHLGAAGVDQNKQDAPAMIQTNIMGTLAMLRLAQMLKSERFIYCGSCFEYGQGNLLAENTPPNPSSEYGASKASAWILVNTFHQKYNLPVVTLRPFTAYGPFEASYRLVPHVINSIIGGKDIKLTGGEQKRDFVFIGDVAEGFCAAAAFPGIEGETFNLTTGQAVSIKEVVATIIELTGSRARPLFGALPYRASELWMQSGDPSKAKNKLGWSAQTILRDGLEKTISWFKENRIKYPAYTEK
ncbi:MAG TPA: NAD-dependent epimerase/dehydratase family protein [Candidatus Omnitrophota bacterium]|nr:NAD-dependent epimerase/dehydratase family protein [Candidatus Omnitrophota bacterium]HPD84115.1 NAD-dependent epimerase/dehydratase family protein [Candidatus Omnitrophota bacterium]HRZ02972.1 NAD-dependent epimerase/dehydratase family protein [Candidatus Omnitrophota bacterium]